MPPLHHPCSMFVPPSLTHHVPCKLQDSQGQGANTQAFPHHGLVTMCVQAPGQLSLAVELPAFCLFLGKKSEPPDSLWSHLLASSRLYLGLRTSKIPCSQPLLPFPQIPNLWASGDFLIDWVRSCALILVASRYRAQNSQLFLQSQEDLQVQN